MFTCGPLTPENVLHGIGKDCDHSSLSVNCTFPSKYQILGSLPPATKLRQGNVFTPVCDSVHWNSLSQHAPQVTWPGGLCPGRSLSRDGLCPGGPCLGGLCAGGTLCRRSLSRGVSVWGVSVQGWSLSGRPPIR